MYPSNPPRIAVINSNKSVLETVTTLLEDEGYTVIPALADTFLREKERFSQFIDEHAPQVVLWDIGPPYEVNWQHFQQIRALPQMQGRPCILTTTDAKRLEAVTATSRETWNIVGKPFELEKMLSAIENALACQQT